MGYTLFMQLLLCRYPVYPEAGSMFAGADVKYKYTGSKAIQVSHYKHHEIW